MLAVPPYRQKYHRHRAEIDCVIRFNVARPTSGFICMHRGIYANDGTDEGAHCHAVGIFTLFARNRRDHFVRSIIDNILFP